MMEDIWWFLQNSFDVSDFQLIRNVIFSEVCVAIFYNF